MPLYNDVMVDIETTGLSVDHSAIIQITAVSFDLQQRQIDHGFFNQCLELPPTRFWDESTRSWWLTMPDTLESIYRRMRDPATVMREFFDWCGGSNCGLTFWAKPLSFDFPFLGSYFREFGPCMPFDFRRARDMRSFLGGLAYPAPAFNDGAVPFEGEKHNALFDTLHQVKCLFEATEDLSPRMEIFPPS